MLHHSLIQCNSSTRVHAGTGASCMNKVRSCLYRASPSKASFPFHFPCICSLRITFLVLCWKLLSTTENSSNPHTVISCTRCAMRNLKQTTQSDHPDKNRENTENGIHNIWDERDCRERAENKNSIHFNGALYIQCTQWALFIQVHKGLTEVLTSTWVLIKWGSHTYSQNYSFMEYLSNSLPAPCRSDIADRGLTDWSQSDPVLVFFSQSGSSWACSLNRHFISFCACPKVFGKNVVSSTYNKSIMTIFSNYGNLFNAFFLFKLGNYFFQFINA